MKKVRRHSRTENACKGLTDVEIEVKVNKMYKDFCKYRYEIAHYMPDQRTGLYTARIFDGRFFNS